MLRNDIYMNKIHLTRPSANATKWHIGHGAGDMIFLLGKHYKVAISNALLQVGIRPHIMILPWVSLGSKAPNK